MMQHALWAMICNDAAESKAAMRMNQASGPSKDSRSCKKYSGETVSETHGAASAWFYLELVEGQQCSLLAPPPAHL